MTDKTFNGNGPECPYCHKVIEPDGQYFYNDDRIEYECGWCEKSFTFTYHRSDTWVAKPET